MHYECPDVDPLVGKAHIIIIIHGGKVTCGTELALVK